MVTILLCSCLALPKVVYAFPPSFLHQVLLTFDNLMHDAPSDLVGAPLSDWSWHKASLPSSLGGLSIWRIVLHALATCLSSCLQFQSLVSNILSHVPPSVDIQTVVASLADAAGRLEWKCVEDINLTSANSCSCLPHVYLPKWRRGQPVAWMSQWFPQSSLSSNREHPLCRDML